MKQFIILIAFFCITTFATKKVAAQSAIPQKAEDISPLLIGEKIPSATLSDALGKEVDLGKIIAQKPTILIFYRGGWCPYCNLQLSGLQQIEAELKKTGYQVIAVSTDKPENLKQSADKGKLSYTLLSDADLFLAKQVGIAYTAPQAYHKMLIETSGGKNKAELLPIPSVFILDKKGEIHFEYIQPDFKKRISPELLKAAAMAIYHDLK